MNNGYWFTTENGTHIHANSGESKTQAMNRQFSTNNRKNLGEFLKEQHNIDIEKSATEKQFSPRKGLNIDSRKLDKNEFHTLQKALFDKSIIMESNGVNDFFIRYK